MNTDKDFCIEINKTIYEIKVSEVYALRGVNTSDALEQLLLDFGYEWKEIFAKLNNSLKIAKQDTAKIKARTIGVYRTVPYSAIVPSHKSQIAKEVSKAPTDTMAKALVEDNISYNKAYSEVLRLEFLVERLDNAIYLVEQMQWNIKSKRKESFK